MAPTDERVVVNDLFPQRGVAVLSPLRFSWRTGPGIHGVDEVKAQASAHKFHVLVAQNGVHLQDIVTDIYRLDRLHSPAQCNQYEIDGWLQTGPPCGLCLV